MNKTKIQQLYTLLLGIVVLSLTGACDRSYLYPWPPDAARTPEDVWNFYDYAKGFLDAVGADNMVNPYWCDISGGGMLASASDEAEHSDPSGAVQKFTNGVWNPTNVPTIRYGGPWTTYAKYASPWANSYEAIRRVNIYLENVDHSAIIDDVSDPAKAHDRTYGKGHAYFLRAFFMFDLFRNYGCFPISTKSLDISENIFLPKNTLEECYTQIIEDCDKAIEMLPLLWDDNNWHKPNKTVAQALKSRVTLYYASPLYQGEYDSFGLAANTVGDRERWITAVKAARDAINDNAFYNLMPVTKFTRPYANTGTYSNQVGLQINLAQKEMIWGTPASSNYSINNEINNMPTGIEGCNGYANPTQEMVDAFEVVTDHNKSTAKAVPFDWNNPDHAKNPYANRDPRFYASIIYNGLLWGISSSKNFYIETYEGGLHNKPTNPKSTKTGYYYRKYLSETFYANKSGNYSNITRSRIVFRFAELLLNYAEAMNEAYGPEVPDPDGALRVGPANALEALNMIRERVKMPPVPGGLTQSEMREKIKHERRIELCFEGHRMYDLRRWKEGEKLGEAIHGIKITPVDVSENTPTGYKYEVVKVEDRVWRNCMYWWPIPYSEIVKFEGKLIQNPEW